MRSAFICLAESISQRSLSVKQASVALLPPKPLLRRLLRAHRLLPLEMQSMGDDYVKSEFRRHRDTSNPLHIMGFLSQWKLYLDQMPTNQSNGRAFTGQRLDPTMYEKMSAEQLGQLYELMHATQDVWKTPEQLAETARRDNDS